MPRGRPLRRHLSRVTRAALIVTRAALSTFAAAAAFGGAALSARAQTVQTSPARQQASTPAPATEADGEPDLSITGRVTARELLFRKVPNPKVEFTGRPRRDTAWEAERENLPAEVRPGVTYRDIGITLRITSVFADIDRIVAEALGEVPATDDATPARPPSQLPARPPVQLDVTPTTRQPPPSAPTNLSPAPSAFRGGTTQPRRSRPPRGGRGQ
jgi:hypothetical protein